MSSLNLTANFSFEPRFCRFNVNGYYTKSKCLQRLDFLFYLCSGDFPFMFFHRINILRVPFRKLYHIYRSCLLAHHKCSSQKDLERSLQMTFRIPIVSQALEIINCVEFNHFQKNEKPVQSLPVDLTTFQFVNYNRKVDILIKMRDQPLSYNKLVLR